METTNGKKLAQFLDANLGSSFEALYDESKNGLSMQAESIKSNFKEMLEKINK